MLCELGLSIRSCRFVTNATSNLNVSINRTHQQHLFELLWNLESKIGPASEWEQKTPEHHRSSFGTDSVNPT